LTVEVARHKTALTRTSLSRPVARALEDGLISEGTKVFDYGCGRGGDVKRLRKVGAECVGYDPNFYPDEPLRPSEVVNLGYVVNVIEDERERAQVLKRAWDLAEGVLVISARLQSEGRRVAAEASHADGVVTGLGTFQRFFRQDELRDWIDATLGVSCIAAEPGIFYTFRDPARAELYLLTRVRRSRPHHRKSDVVFEDKQEILRPLMDFIEETGRLPRAGEFPQEPELRDAVGTPRQAFQIIKTVTGEERWDRARMARYEDLLVYLVLSRFRRRPMLSHLPQGLQYDIKDYFGSYKAACGQADRVLFGIGDQDRIREAIIAAKVGKRMPSALYVHTSAIPELPVTLRVLEGCAQELLGTVPDATIVKIDRDRPRVGYLEYPSFDVNPHPALRGAYTVSLDSLNTSYWDYSERTNPPILHRKERFVGVGYPLRRRFERLTRQEKGAGLLSEPTRIGTERGWRETLHRAGLEVHGHRLKRIQ
jgi:DNA phosphorothioation-associated putative methyltransferase